MNGLLILDKPLRMSSAQAVAAVKRRLPERRWKVGHAGTLDPLATGVLVIAIGPATKSIEHVMVGEKRYSTTIDLSAFTTTDDVEGERTEVAPARQPTELEVREMLSTRFHGRIMQRPPAFSAVKVQGQRAYALARRGEAPKIEARPVLMHEVNLLAYDWPLIELDLRCGKGFYVRALARDLGEALGTGGFCVAIRRTAVGPFHIAMARSLDSLPKTITQADLAPLPAASTPSHSP